MVSYLLSAVCLLDVLIHGTPECKCLITMSAGHLFAIVQGFEVRLEVALSAVDVSALWTGMDLRLARVLLLPVAEEGAPALEDPAGVVAQEDIFARRIFPVFLVHYSSVTLQVVLHLEGRAAFVAQMVPCTFMHPLNVYLELGTPM